MTDTQANSSDQFRGWLYKWTNYIKGYQKRWFVLQNGFLSYYRNQTEMSRRCRGTINLANAFTHTEDSCSFVIANRGRKTFYLKASSEIERQKWVTALELAKAKAISQLESDDEADENEEQNHQPDKVEIQDTLRQLGTKLEDLNTCNDLVTKHGAALQKALGELEQNDTSGEFGNNIKTANERAALLRLSSKAMVDACHDYLEFAASQGRRWQRMMVYEHERRVRLEQMVEQLAKQHSYLEKMARKSLSAVNVGRSGSLKLKKGDIGPPLSDEEDEDEEEDEEEIFHDAVDVDEFDVCLPRKMEKSRKHGGFQRTSSTLSVDSQGAGPEDSSSSSDTDSEEISEVQAKVIYHKSNQRPSSQEKPRGISSRNSSASSIVRKQRRAAIPEKPNYSVNLWSILKTAIGKDLTQIAMPVNFHEPLSFLQRLTEDFEYSECLDKAARCEDQWEQLAYVAAFTASSYANSSLRAGKPFNPLLGETFECDRYDDMGWKCFAEQVSHHPPMCAMDCEGRHGWRSWQEFTMSSKFRGKYLQIVPHGIAHCLFHKSGNHYTWRKVTTTVHNIIVGKLWVDNHGEMDITNHKTGDNCHLKYSVYSYFSRETSRKVTGVITDSAGTAKWVLQGTWDDKMEGAKVLKTTKTSKGKIVYETGDTKILWKRRHYPELSKCYNYTTLAVELNEMEEGVAPTDSRYRPDQRLMENGDWDEANKTKVALEEKQRAARRRREQEAEQASAEGKEYVGWEPRWFRQKKDPQTGNLIHMTTEEYWKCKGKGEWSRCPDIYL